MKNKKSNLIESNFKFFTEKIYFILIIFSIGLIFLDAYEIFFIPVPWIGSSFLFAIAILNYKKIKNNITTYLIVFILIPQLYEIFFFSQTTSDVFYIFLRMFNIVSFIFTLFFAFHYFDQENIDKLFKFINVFICFFSISVIYIFIAQIYDFFEPFRNRGNTDLFSNAQSIFWLSQPHRAMGTFREPVLLVSFFFPLVILFLYYSKEKILIPSILSGVALGLTRSNLLILFSILFLIFLGIQFLINKKIKFQYLIFFSLVFVFSTFSVLECNLNPQSNDCIEYEEVVQRINNSGELKIGSELDEPVFNLGNERTKILEFFIYSTKFLNPSSFLQINSKYQDYSTSEINNEMYFSNRTLPNYLLKRYSTKNFGTGSYSLIGNKPNLQNLFVFYTLSYGIIFPVLIFLLLVHFFTFKIINFESVLFLMFLLFFFVCPIEEVNAYSGLFLGIAYKLCVKDRITYEQI